MANTTPICDNPINTGFLSSSGFLFSIKKCPNVNFFAQVVNIPGLTLASADSGNPFAKIRHEGDHIDFNELEVTFKINEDMSNYMEIYNWIRQTGFPEKYEERQEIERYPISSGLGLRSDITIMILNNSKTAIFTCTVKDAFPVMLSDIEFNSTNQDTQYLTCRAMFMYTNYTLEKV